MFFDARKLRDDLPSDMDVCVVGAGIAGLVIARRLEGTGLKVWLIESGDRKERRDAQALNAGASNLSDYPFQGSRARAFGGTSTRWTGACVPLDSSDFETRDWLPHSGWPISLKDLEPHLEGTRVDFGVGDTGRYEASLKGAPFDHPDLAAQAISYAEPLDLGTRYGGLIEQSADIHCLLNGTVTELVPDDSGTRVGSVVISAGGEPIRVNPRIVVLACGGIENPRLLLASNSVQPGGLGNAHDVVGRYHMEHPIRTVGVLPVGDRWREFLSFTNEDREGGRRVQGTFGLSAAARRREKLWDLHLRCYRYGSYEDQPPIIEGKRVVFGSGGTTGRSGGLRGALSAVHPMTLGYLWWHARNKIFRNAVFDHVRMTAFVEQEPDPENRITLDAERDAFGRRLPFLKLQESRAMKDSIHRSMAVMAKAFDAAGLPGLRYRDEDLAHLRGYDAYGLHHMGGTRMSDDPKTGVVDRDCRVHGLDNLFVAGSSVFPTGGAANPSWTIAALALRLADDIQRRIRTI